MYSFIHLWMIAFLHWVFVVVNQGSQVFDPSLCTCLKKLDRVWGQTQWSYKFKYCDVVRLLLVPKFQASIQ